jgi:twitching motility protein PilT
MRHDPDIILVGEMRELETIKLALSCASMGMLVFGTLHTNNAPKTIDRIINAFPAQEQNQVRVMLAGELLVANSAVIALIRDGKTQGLRNVLETGKREGMYLMENVVFELWEQGKISAETARKNISTRMLQAKIT